MRRLLRQTGFASEMERERLERMRDVLGGYVDRREMPGLVTLVSQRDEVHVETIGSLAFDNPAPMGRETIFRIASLSKLIVAAAAMILVEDCKLRLEDSIEPWLPELAKRRVLKSIASDLDDTVPARRAITVRDLLTYRMGFGSVMAMPDTYPIQKKAIRELKIGGDGPPRPTEAPETDEWLKRLGSLPWMAQPGEKWMYHVSCDVLGVLIARVTGQTLGTFLQERIFEPLGMKDTGFWIPGEKMGRLAGVYLRNLKTNKLAEFESVAHSHWSAPPPFESAGGGLVSTIDDYSAFCRMMLNKGKLAKARVLSRASVELMTADQLTPEQRADATIFFGTHSSWGLGMAVDIGRSEIYHNPGRFGWTGGFGTTAYVDPANEAVGILFTQRMMESPEPPKVFTDSWTLAYGAID